MGKNKKKKKNPNQQKMEAAHQKNLYLKKIKTMMGVLGDSSAFNLLGPIDLAVVYKGRMRPVRLVAPEDISFKITKKQLAEINNFLDEILQKDMIDLNGSGIQVSLYDFFTLVETIYLNWNSIESRNSCIGQRIADKLPVLRDFKSIYDETYNKLLVQVNGVSLSMSNILSRLCWLEVSKHTQDMPLYDKNTWTTNFIIHAEKPPTEVVQIDGKKRTAFRVGITTNTGVTWLELDPKNLGLHQVNHKALKVFIQSHVLERFMERLGKGFHAGHYGRILLALFQTNVSRSDDGQLLFPVTMQDITLGYLKADVIGNKLLVRTFLFVTNNGTPEGKKLAQLLHVQKEDKKYLGIDKLDTFIRSDIGDNEKLKAAFCEAGCGGLFRVKDLMVNIPENPFHFADFAARYLMLKEENEQYQWPEETDETAGHEEAAPNTELETMVE